MQMSDSEFVTAKKMAMSEVKLRERRNKYD